MVDIICLHTFLHVYESSSICYLVKATNSILDRMITENITMTKISYPYRIEIIYYPIPLALKKYILRASG